MISFKQLTSRLLPTAMLLLASCTTDTTEEFLSTAPQSWVTLCPRDDSAFVVTQETTTRSTGSITEEAATETTIHDLNLYIWRTGTTDVRHIYTSSPTDTFFISYGQYEIRAVANLGRSYEEEGVTDSPEALDDPERFNVRLFSDRMTRNIMSYRGQFEANRETTTLEITLTRLVAKISYNIWDASPKASIVFLSAQACNLPTAAGIFRHENTCYPADDLSYINGEIVESPNGKSLTDTFYMYENLKPENPSISEQKQRIEENAPEGATYLLIRFYYATTPSKIYTAKVYIGNGDVSNFTLQRNQQLKLSIPVYSATDIRITYETSTARANNEDIIYFNTTQEYNHQLADIFFETTGSGTSHVGNWWIKPEGPANNDDDYLVYSTDDGATWQPCTPGEFMNVYVNAASARKVHYLFARHLTRNHKNFRKDLLTYKFSVYYGDTEKVLLREVQSQRKMYFPLDLDTEGDDDYDCNLTRFTINGYPAGDFTDVVNFPAWCQDVDIEFNYPAYYTYMGLYHNNGQRIRQEPDDVEEIDGRIYVRYMGVCADHFLQEGPGTLYVTFYLPERVRLQVPRQKGFTISTTFDCAAGEIKRWNDADNTAEFYEVPFGTVATLVLKSQGNDPNDLDQADVPFEGWRQSALYEGNTSTLIEKTGTCKVTMNADYTIKPSWYVPIVLDKAGTYANCYVVNKAGYYEFNAHHAGSRDNIVEPDRLEILWQDALGGGSPQILSRLYYDPTSGRTTFLADDQTGSAVIAGYKKNNPIPVWSWHIWCPGNYTPNADNYGLMTRNLGALRDANAPIIPEDVNAAIRAGYLYQGGRHEPFPLIMSEIEDNVNAPAALTLVPNTQTPDGPLQMRGGYSTTAWNTETKSTHDPCPYGWRVPTRSQLTSRVLNLFNNLEITYDAPYNRIRKNGISFPLYGIYYQQTTSSYRPECLYNAWRNNLRTTIYAYANGYYEVQATRQSDTSTIPLILLGTPPEYETRILGGMVRCIKDN